ncbi:MAG: DUF5719 family protein [Pseudoclavibacter sp.]|nr:DUF5719 family protein [Pseudoclavibacter sp.]
MRGRPERSAAAGGSRLRAAGGALAALAGGALLAVAGWGSAALPLPRIETSAPSVAVAVAPGAQQRVCPGGLAAPSGGGEAGLAVTGSVTPLAAGDLERLSSAGLAGDAEGAAGASAPVAYAAPGTRDDGVPTSLSVSQLVDAQDPRATGLSVTPCAQPLAEQWLLGGSTALGSASVLSLVNPTGSTSTVRLELHGPQGPIEAPGTSGIEVPAFSQRLLPLAGFAPEVAELAVHVLSSGGTIAASLHRSDAAGTTPLGVEILPAVPAAAERLRFVSVPFTASAQEAGAPVSRAKGASLRLLAPGESPVRVSLGLRDPDGARLEPVELVLQPGVVTDVPLGDAPVGRYTVEADGDGPLLGALRTTTASGRSDSAWALPAPPLTGEQAIGVARGPDPRLAVYNPGEAAVELELHGPDGEQRIRVEPGASWQQRVAPGGYRLLGLEGESVSLGYAGEGRLALLAVTPGNPLAGPVTVYR